MHSYPAWRLWLVAVVMAIAVVLALPNVFGDAPALHISRDDRAAFTEQTKGAVTGILAAKSIPVDDAHLEGDRLVLRFDDAAQQVQAREAITAAAPREYLIALSQEPRMPGWLRALGLRPMSLGLDLRGGVYFLYEVDVKGAVKQLLESMERDYRTLLRDERIPFTGMQSNGVDTVTIQLRTGADAERVASLLRKQDPNIVVDTGTLGEGGAVSVKLTPDRIKERQDFAIQQNITTLRNRVDELGVTEPIVARQGADRITVQLPGVQDPNEALRVLGATATLEFRLVDDQNDAAQAEATGRAPLGSRLYHTRENSPVLLKRDMIVSGEQLVDASSGFQEGQPAVYVKLDARGAAEMLATTRENLGRPMAVVFIETMRVKDDEPCNGTRSGTECTVEEVISVATIRGVFSSNFQITGLLAGEARELALLLRAGALAAPLYIVEQRTVGPSLGQDNVDRGFKALVVGLIGMFIFLAIYYRPVRHRGQRRAVHEHGPADGPDVAAAGDAVVAGHRGHRADDRYGRRRQRPHLRAHPRGVAQWHEPARGDQRRLRQGIFGHCGLQYHDADRRHRALHLWFGSRARVRRDAVSRYRLRPCSRPSWAVGQSFT